VWPHRVEVPSDQHAGKALRVPRRVPRVGIVEVDVHIASLCQPQPGAFSPAAVKEATRDGAPPIDLVDGSELADKLRDLGLGVRKEMIEVVRVDERWFASV